MSLGALPKLRPWMVKFTLHCLRFQLHKEEEEEEEVKEVEEEELLP